MSPDPQIDCAGLAALQQGDTTALNRLIARWQRPLLGYAYRYLQNSADAHDAVANVFVRLYQQRHQLRPDTKLSAWLFTTLTNLCHNQYRWRRRHPAVPLEGAAREEDDGPAPAYQVPSEQPGPAGEAAADEALAAVRAAIEQLPHDLKMTVLLHHYQNLSYREIAEITHCSERGVETRLYRARQTLRQALAGFIREVSNC